jgi:hypothetical protein
MGTSYRASLSLGFVIREEELHLLLEALRRHTTDATDGDPAANSENATNEDGAHISTAESSNTANPARELVKLSEEDIRELVELAEYAAAQKGLGEDFEFTVRTTHGDYTDTGMAVAFVGGHHGYCAETWGRYEGQSFSPFCMRIWRVALMRGCFSVEPAFVTISEPNKSNDEKELKEKIEKLAEALYFKEAMIEEFEVDECEWILRVVVG